MLALFGKTLDNATGGCFRRSDEICSEAPPVCTALIWRFGDGVESHISCHLAGLWPCSTLYSAVCSAHSPRAGLIGVIEYLWAQNRHLREKWEIHSFCWETWSSQTHTLETLDCTHTDRHTHSYTLWHSHTDYLRNKHKSAYSRAHKRVFANTCETEAFLNLLLQMLSAVFGQRIYFI